MLALTCFKLNNASTYNDQIFVDMLSSCDENGNKIVATLKLDASGLENTGFVSTQLARGTPDNVSFVFSCDRLAQANTNCSTLLSQITERTNATIEIASEYLDKHSSEDTEDSPDYPFRVELDFVRFEDRKSVAVGGLVMLIIFAAVALVFSIAGAAMSYRSGYFVKSGSAGDRKARMKSE